MLREGRKAERGIQSRLRGTDGQAGRTVFESGRPTEAGNQVDFGRAVRKDR
jgi:hypothetical protein